MKKENKADDSQRNPLAGRRPFLKGGGLAMLGAFMAGKAGAQEVRVDSELSAQEAANLRLVNDFCASWATRDMDRITSFLASESSYRMTEETPAVTGPQGVRDQLQSWVEASDAVEFRVLETWARGPLVVNHRIDTFDSEAMPLTWQGVGVFLVKNDEILEWFDYTIEVRNSV